VIEARSRSLVDIGDDNHLYWRLAPVHFRFDGTVISSAFKRGKDWDREISVDLARLTTVEEAVARARRPEVAGLGSLVAGFPRSLGFSVRHAPSLRIGPTPSSKARTIGQNPAAWPRL
jgi:hypothetical protein